MLRPIVTLFESFGSGAATIGPAVAAELGVPFLGQYFSAEELMTAELPEPRDDGLLERLLGRLGRAAASADIGVFTGAREEQELADRIAELRDAVRDGGVVLGRDATVVLADLPGSLHVRLDGPLARRAAREAHALGVDVAEAEARALRDESIRSEMSLRHFNWDPRVVDRYDLIVNTELLGPALAAEVIVASWKLKSSASGHPDV